jgi:hypothetical protein
VRAWPELEVSRLPRAEDEERAQAIVDRISSSRALEDWRQHDPVLIAQLAVVQVELDKIMVQLSAEGWTTLGGKHRSTPVRSPLIGPARHLATRSLALARALGITGEPADADTVANRAKTASAASRAMAGDDLAMSRNRPGPTARLGALWQSPCCEALQSQRRSCWRGASRG